MVSLQNLSCSFESETILKDISLDISAHLSILGANGSGKSTLAKAICNLISFEGNILLDGVDITHIPLLKRAKSICYIPTKLELHDAYITVEEFVLMGRFAYKREFFEYSHEDIAIAQESLKFLQIAHLATKRASSLSSGEQQLLLIAQALTQQSKIIIFDEPTANLDPSNAKIIAKHIKNLKEKHTIFLITHDLHLACYIDSPIAFIKEQSLHSYAREFFSDETLERLYGVSFSSLAVRYD